MKRHIQRGISLIELMVALVVGVILVGGIVQIYAANKQTYRVDDASARLQENARYAMALLARDIRMAGYQGCAGQARILVNTLNDTSSFLYNFDQAIEGFEATGAGTWSPTLDGGITSPLGGRDVITIRAVFDSGVAITGQPSNSGDCTSAASHTADLKVSDASAFNPGDIVIAGNCSRASIFQITNVNAGSNVVHNTGGSVTPGNATRDLGACYAGNGELAKITTRTFYLRNNPDGLPSLYRKDGNASAEELVEGVEDMQILYGIDTDGDGAANQFVRANNVSDWSQVTSVRIGLLLQSVEDNITTTPQTYTFNDTTVTPTDRRLRRVFTTTIGLRNQLP